MSAVPPRAQSMRFSSSSFDWRDNDLADRNTSSRVRTLNGIEQICLTDGALCQLTKFVCSSALANNLVDGI